MLPRPFASVSKVTANDSSGATGGLSRCRPSHSCSGRRRRRGSTLRCDRLHGWSRSRGDTRPGHSLVTCRVPQARAPVTGSDVHQFEWLMGSQQSETSLPPRTRSHSLSLARCVIAPLRDDTIPLCEFSAFDPYCGSSSHYRTRSRPMRIRPLKNEVSCLYTVRSMSRSGNATALKDLVRDIRM